MASSETVDAVVRLGRRLLLHPTFLQFQTAAPSAVLCVRRKDTTMKTDEKRVERNGDLVRLGENIRNRREALGMSQTELANKIGSERARISGYENGDREMGICKLLAIVNALNCTADEICGQQKAENDLVEVMERLQGLPSGERAKFIGFMKDMLTGIEARCAGK